MTDRPVPQPPRNPPPPPVVPGEPRRFYDPKPATVMTQVADVLDTHRARRGDLGLCTPNIIELVFYPNGRPDWNHNTGKIIFATETHARAAADGIAAIIGADPVEPYPCPRADHYHLRHITKNNARKTG